MSEDVAPEHPDMEGTAGAGETAPSLRGDPAECGPEHGLRAGAGAGGGDSEEARDTRPESATCFIETRLGMLSYAELAPLLAELVAIVEWQPLMQIWEQRLTLA